MQPRRLDYLSYFDRPRRWRLLLTFAALVSVGICIVAVIGAIVRPGPWQHPVLYSLLRTSIFVDDGWLKFSYHKHHVTSGIFRVRFSTVALVSGVLSLACIGIIFVGGRKFRGMGFNPTAFARPRDLR